MTESELRMSPIRHLSSQSSLPIVDVTMTSGFSTIAGSVLVAYINLGVPPATLVTSSVMSIPASISISKMRLPETEEPVTRGTITIDRGAENEKDRPVRDIDSLRVNMGPHA